MGGLRDNDQLDLMGRLVSPHGWDGMGSVPSLVHEAAGGIARLRVKFVNQWMPGADSPLTTREVNELFDGAAITAEWLREVTEARDHAVAEGERLREALRRLTSSWEDAHIGAAVRRGPWLDRTEFEAIQKLAQGAEP